MADNFNPYYGGSAYLKKIIKEASEKFTGTGMHSESSITKEGGGGSQAGESMTLPARPAGTLARPAAKPSISASQPIVSEDIVSITGEDLIRGILISEILGAPKAKRTGRW